MAERGDRNHPDGGLVVVIGAGAAGILAAYRAAMLGARVLLLEKKDRLGTKILISGGGKCNVTHAGDMESLRRGFRPDEARFLKPAFYRFTNQDIVRMLESRGVRLYTRPDGRIFPVEQTAREVVAALTMYLREARVEIRLNSPVTVIEYGSGSAGARTVNGVRSNGMFVPARHIVLCVGGSSYPGTGTTGDGWVWAQAGGHRLVKVRAALAPLFLEEPRVDWAGVALRDCALRARQGGKIFVSWRSDLLFTHRGLSGPCALGISREVAERRPLGPVQVEVDLLPDQPVDAVTLALREWIQENPRRPISSYVEPLLPARLLKSFLDEVGLTPETPGGQVSARARNLLSQHLKGWPIGAVRHIPLEKGEVVAGGIALDEVDPQTMRSRKVDGLYLCGEILDIAGPVGGYNLQAAWSTGWVAGETAAKDALAA